MEHGEFYECYNCEGLGFVPFKEEAKTPCWIHRDFAKCDACRCDVCWGLGPLDWVENMVGREQPRDEYTSSASCVSCQQYVTSYSCSCSAPLISKHNISAVP